MEILLLIALTAFVISGVWYWSRPRQTLTKREKHINEMRASGVRGRLEAIVDLEEQPPKRFSPRVVRMRRT